MAGTRTGKSSETLQSGRCCEKEAPKSEFMAVPLTEPASVGDRTEQREQ